MAAKALNHVLPVRMKRALCCPRAGMYAAGAAARNPDTQRPRSGIKPAVRKQENWSEDDVQRSATE